jgi:hypothetical protein
MSSPTPRIALLAVALVAAPTGGATDPTAKCLASRMNEAAKVVAGVLTGFAHIDVVSAEDDDFNPIPSELALFITRNVQ